MESEYYVRRLPFPNRSVKAATFPNDDGTFDIYLNTLYPESVQERALLHELKHIRLDHFYSDKPLAQKEAEADGLTPPEPRQACEAREAPEAPLIPLFPSPEAFAHWLQSL